MRFLLALIAVPMSALAATAAEDGELMDKLVNAKGFNQEPNPPTWPASVQVFGPENEPMIEQTINHMTASLNNRTTGHFSDERFAFLFKPGTYTANIKVGYYVQILGLGESAGDVVFTGDRGVYVEAMDKRPGGAGSLDTFWRGAENFRVSSANGLLWAVSP